MERGRGKMGEEEEEVGPAGIVCGIEEERRW